MRLISDAAWAALTIRGEAESEAFEGKVAVGEVILRRTKLKYSSDGTVPGTVLHELQFSCWNTMDPNRLRIAKSDTMDPMVQECLDAWSEAVRGSSYAKGALLYYNPALADPLWLPSTIAVAKIGKHIFCALKGKNDG